MPPATAFSPDSVAGFSSFSWLAWFFGEFPLRGIGPVGNLQLGGSMNANGAHELTLLDQAKQALAEARSFDQIKDIRDKAEAVRRYAQSASLGLDIQNRAAEVKLRAERQAGKLLSQLMLRGGDRRSKLCHTRTKLDDLGISRNQSTRWQFQAIVPENVFRDYVRETCNAGKELTSANLMRLAKQWRVRDRDGNGKNSELNPRNGHSHDNHYLPIDGDSSGTGTLHEIAGELTNHFQILSGLLGPVIKSESAVTLKASERRVLQYLTNEISQLLKRLPRARMNGRDCVCAEDSHHRKVAAGA